MFIESTTQSSANIDALFRKTRLKRHSVAAEAIKKAGVNSQTLGQSTIFIAGNWLFGVCQGITDGVCTMVGARL